MSTKTTPELALFDLSTEGLKRSRKSFAAEVAELKAQYGIFTHLCRGGGEWLALSMPECCAALSEYGLTEEERTNGVALMAGYCRLLDEAGLVEEGHRTEREAVTSLVSRIKSSGPAMQRNQGRDGT